MVDRIAILIDARLHNELVLRTRKTDDVSHIIENVLSDFLERTKFDGDLWSEEYLELLEKLENDGELKKYGDPKKGYYWQTIFLQNGSKLRVTYKGKHSFAAVMHGKLIYDNAECSPSEYASRAANNTNRNAWRDIWVQFPAQTNWKLADVLRREAQS